jgi:hypothetical protein
MTDRPTIGNLRSKPGNEPRINPEPVKAEESIVEEKETKVENETKLTPAEQYRERLKASEIPFEEAAQIYDDVMSKGYHESIVRLGKTGRAVFHTRGYDDHIRLQDQLEKVAPKFSMVTDDIINRFNLAASLCEWHGKIIPHNDEKDFEAALALVRKLPGPAYALLVNELSKLDARVMVIFSDGATENF